MKTKQQQSINVGTWQFGILREARDGRPFSDLADLAQAHDAKAIDETRTVEPRFTVEPPRTEDGRNRLFYDGAPLLDTAVSAAASAAHVSDDFLTKHAAPDVAELVMNRGWQQEHGVSKTMLVRRWNDGSDNPPIRQFCSEKYTPITMVETMKELSENVTGSNLRIVDARESHEGFRADVVDAATSGFDINTLDKPGPVPNDICYAGWRMRGSDVKRSKAKLVSLLWRLVCNNGSSVVDQMATRSKRHIGDGDFVGQIMDMAAWTELILAMKTDQFPVMHPDTMIERISRMKHSPSLDELARVALALVDATSPASKPARSLFAELAIKPAFEGQSLLSTLIERPTFSRWDLAQAAAYVIKNDDGTTSTTSLEAWNAALMTTPLFEQCPLLLAADGYTATGALEMARLMNN